MLTRLTRRLRRLHDDLVYRTYCSPSTGIVGRCDPIQPGPYEHHALGMRPACRWCHRESRP